LPEPANKFTRLSLPRSIRQALAGVVIVVCVFGILNAWRASASRLLTHHGRTAQLLVQTEAAVSMMPSDPEAHSGRAFVLLNMNNLAAALPEYESAAALRPGDYFLWLELGRARDMADDEEGALAALEQAVKLAPQYAQPRWQLGNALFRSGRVEEAFRELRRAAVSDLTLLPNLIDLAWGASAGDAARVEQIVQPERTSWRLALAKFFIKHGKTLEAVAQFRAAGEISKQDRQALLDDLLAARRYQEAYEVWAADSAIGKREGAIASVNDGGFEGTLSRDNLSFGWRLTRDTPAIRLSLDRNNTREGINSLRVDFNGDTNVNQPIIAQLILVEPNARYRLRFAARTEQLVTGGLPVVLINDVGSKENRTLAQSSPLKPGSEEWQELTVDFTAVETTDAVLVTLQRQNCSSSPCPIFGRLWLDDFVIQKIGE
jgi:Tfp pilus assembly protein PilF